MGTRFTFAHLVIAVGVVLAVVGGLAALIYWNAGQTTGESLNEPRNAAVYAVWAGLAGFGALIAVAGGLTLTVAKQIRESASVAGAQVHASE